MSRTKIVIIVLAGLFILLMFPLISDRITDPPDPIIPAESNLTGTDLLELISATGQWGELELTGLISITDADGDVTLDARQAFLDTPGEFGNAGVRTEDFTGWMSGEINDTIDWNNLVILQVVFSTPNDADSADFRDKLIQLGEGSPTIPSSVNQKAIGFNMDDGKIHAFGNTGGFDDTEIVIADIVNDVVYTATVISYGNGECDYILNGELELEREDICPSGSHDGDAANFMFDIERSSGPQVSYYLHQVRYYMEQ